MNMTGEWGGHACWGWWGQPPIKMSAGPLSNDCHQIEVRKSKIFTVCKDCSEKDMQERSTNSELYPKCQKRKMLTNGNKTGERITKEMRKSPHSKVPLKHRTEDDLHNDSVSIGQWTQIIMTLIITINCYFPRPFFGSGRCHLWLSYVPSVPYVIVALHPDWLLYLHSMFCAVAAIV